MEETWRGDIRDPDNNDEPITYRYGPGLENNREKGSFTSIHNEDPFFT